MPTFAAMGMMALSSLRGDLGPVHGTPSAERSVEQSDSPYTLLFVLCMVSFAACGVQLVYLMRCRRNNQTKTLDEIKQLMAASETAQAGEALKELLAKEPDNLHAKMLFGLCRQLLGDEKTFKRIYDEVAPKMERLPPSEQRSETVTLWKKYRALWLSLSPTFQEIYPLKKSSSPNLV